MITRVQFEHLMHVARHRGRLHHTYDLRDPLAVFTIIADLQLVGHVDSMALDEVRRTYNTGSAGGRWQRYQRALADPVNMFDF